MGWKKINLKIFVAYHQPWKVYEDDVFVPIQVWKKESSFDLWILWDDTWDNISYLNDKYSELTWQYWVWKNYDLTDVDFIDSMHPDKVGTNLVWSRSTYVEMESPGV